MSQITSNRMKGNLEILLAEWGAWKRGENRNPLGYPGSSAFQQMRVDEMEMKPIGCAQPDYIYSVSVTLMAEEVIA